MIEDFAQRDLQIKKSILISVIVPVYNVELYLEECLKSICNQTYKNIEIIIVNDGSTDNSLNICEEYLKKDKRIKLINQNNKGLSSARNVGIDISTGHYITFVDSDDCINKRYCEQLLDDILKSKADISICNFIRFKKEIKNIEKTKASYAIYNSIEACEQQFFSGDMRVAFVTSWGKLYKRNLFDDLRFPVGKIHEDEFITYKCFLKAKKIVFNPTQYYYYRINEKSITNKEFSIKRYNLIEALEEKEEIFKKLNAYNLLNKSTKQKNILIAKFYIYAKKFKIKKEIPKHYKIGIIRALKNIYFLTDKNEFEYYINIYNKWLYLLYIFIRKII